VRPQPPCPSGYPRLGAAWRILVGAAPLALGSGVVHADASTPPCPHTRKPTDGKQKGGGKPEPQPAPLPILAGKMAAPNPPPTPPTPPTAGVPPPPATPSPPKKREVVPRLDGDIPAPEQVRLIHPHGPDEPCLSVGDEWLWRIT
jgi:Wiskott-Aldrich syndrome protein